MVDDRLLHHTQWLDLREIVAPHLWINGYVYSHEVRCDGHVVVILPFRTIDCELFSQFQSVVSEVLLRSEVTPCWHVVKPQLSSITGGHEHGDTYERTAVRELWEESGYVITEKELIPLGTCRGTKSTDTIYHLYAVNLTRTHQTGDGHGDGSTLEANATCIWVSVDHIINSVDPLVYIAYHRLTHSRNNNLRRIIESKSW